MDCGRIYRHYCPKTGHASDSVPCSCPDCDKRRALQDPFKDELRKMSEKKTKESALLFLPMLCERIENAIRNLVATTKAPIWKTDLAFAGDMIQIGPDVTFVHPQLTDYYKHGHHQDEFLPQFEEVWRKRHPQMQFSSKGIAGQYLVDWEH